MVSANLIETIELTRKTLRDNINALHSEAEQLVNEYWSEWKERNKIEINTPHPSSELKRTYLGSYAPRMVVIGHGKKKTVHWYKFKPFKNKPPNHMSQKVDSKSGGYTKSCFLNHATWEWEMIERTENKLKPFRDLLEYYHVQYIELGRKLRHLNTN